MRKIERKEDLFYSFDTNVDVSKLDRIRIRDVDLSTVDTDLLIFYDIEVFKHQSCVVFKKYDGSTDRIFTNNLSGLGSYIDKGIIKEQGYQGLREYLKGKILVGYNNYHYDDYILNVMSNKMKKEAEKYRQVTIKALNDMIISGRSISGFNRVDQLSLDCYQQIDVSRPSLKYVEGNMGKSIIESSVDFTIERELTPDENLQTIKYCEYDVSQTIDIFKMRRDYFNFKQMVVLMLSENIQDKAIYWNTTSITGQVFKWRKGTQPSNYALNPNYLYDLVPHEVAEFWSEVENVLKFDEYKFKKKSCTMKLFGNVVTFAWGGLHGAPDRYIERKNVKLLDVGLTYWLN